MRIRRYILDIEGNIHLERTVGGFRKIANCEAARILQSHPEMALQLAWYNWPNGR